MERRQTWSAPLSRFPVAAVGCVCAFIMLIFHFSCLLLMIDGTVPDVAFNEDFLEIPTLQVAKLRLPALKSLKEEVGSWKRKFRTRCFCIQKQAIHFRFLSCLLWDGCAVLTKL